MGCLYTVELLPTLKWCGQWWVVVIMSHLVVKLYKLTYLGEFTRMVDHSLNYDGSYYLLSCDVYKHRRMIQGCAVCLTMM